MQDTRNVQKKIAGTQRGVQLLKCITDYKGVITSQADGQEPDGFALVPETVQVIRAEFLQEMLRAGIKAYAHTIVSPAIDYWKQTIEVKKGAHLARMKAVCIFNPLHVLAHKTCSGLTTCSPSRAATAATAASISSTTRATPATPASLKEMEKAVVAAGGRSLKKMKKGGKAKLRAVLTSAMQGDEAFDAGLVSSSIEV
jgi:hypothetical protein